MGCEERKLAVSSSLLKNLSIEYAYTRLGSTSYVFHFHMNEYDEKRRNWERLHLAAEYGRMKMVGKWCVVVVAQELLYSRRFTSELKTKNQRVFVDWNISVISINFPPRKINDIIVEILLNSCAKTFFTVNSAGSLST